MAVESATYPKDLQDTRPAGNEPASEGDDHLRLIKSVLKNTFPNLGSPIPNSSWQLEGCTLFSGGRRMIGCNSDAPPGFSRVPMTKPAMLCLQKDGENMQEAGGVMSPKNWAKDLDSGNAIPNATQITGATGQWSNWLKTVSIRYVMTMMIQRDQANALNAPQPVPTVNNEDQTTAVAYQPPAEIHPPEWDQHWDGPNGPRND